MSVLSVQTKKIPELRAITGLVGSDMIIVELAGGGTRKMTYSNLIAVIQASLKGDKDAMMTIASISSIQTDEAGKVPSSALVKGMNDDFAIMKREQRCINEGMDGVEWGLDDLMTLVRNGEFNKFAIGDSFVDGSIHWRIFAKNHYPKWAFDGAVGEAPNHIVCLPDEALGTHRYNSSGTNKGGYAASEMPSYLESTILPKLSAGLRSYIKQTQIYENNKGSCAAAKRNMRIPTVTECTGANYGWTDYYSGSICSQLPLMRASRHRVKTYWYWCLDPAINDIDFCSINIEGNMGIFNASYNSGSVRPEIVLA